MLPSADMRRGLWLMLVAGCLDPYRLEGSADGGIDVGELPNRTGAFGPEDAGPVDQLDLARVTARYHPPGFAASTLHGPEMKLQKQDCRLCHGGDLTGGSSPVSCDNCHRVGWRSTCSFCHGSDPSGLPPRDVGGETDPARISFPAHGKHAAGNLSSPFACTQCHRPNLDAMSNLHVFDPTPARAEVLMAGGLSNTSLYDLAAKSCSSNYCHGDGRTAGTITFDAPPRNCHSCHADMTTPNLWNTMSGDHARHLRLKGVNCTSCHNGVVQTDPGIISDRTRHLDGKRNLQFAPAGISFDVATRRCTGSCHGTGHNDTW